METVQNRFAEGPNDEKSLRLARANWTGLSQSSIWTLVMSEDDRYTIVQEFSEGTVAYYAFIPSRLSRGRSYRDVIESTLHTTVNYLVIGGESWGRVSLR